MRILLTLLLAVGICGSSQAHPAPDIPVRSTFNDDGTVTIRVELDPRCFAEDPMHEPYLENADFQSYTPEQKTGLLSRARRLIDDSIEFRLLPGGPIQPEFEMRFTTFAGQPLLWNVEKPAENTAECGVAPVVVTAEWTVDASKATGYQIKARKAGKFSVHFVNRLGEKEQRLHVLFPGEESYVLGLKGWAESLKGG
ncbi:MAG TPA: hypothetical protein VMN36_16155 [Verrucomicrobiales bacterium]|nr:hypothetical protein [Verrucomicrobiales bacterium]